MMRKKPRQGGPGGEVESGGGGEPPEVQVAAEEAEGSRVSDESSGEDEYDRARSSDAPAEKEASAISSEIRDELRELEELRERHLRLAAEFENYRKRTRRELAEAGERGQAALVGRLLEALDDLGRVADTPVESATVETLHEGVALVERKLLKALNDAGLAPVQADGEPFDPNIHEALLSIPTSDPQEDDTVDQVLLTGYVFRDRLLRPAKVVVKNLEGTDIVGRQPGTAEDAGGDPPESHEA